MNDTENLVVTPQEEQRQRALVQAWLRRHLKEFTLFWETSQRSHADLMEEFLQEKSAKYSWDEITEANRVIRRFAAELRTRQLWIALDELHQATTRPDYHIPPRNANSAPETEKTLFMVDAAETMTIAQWIMEVPWDMLKTYLTYKASGLGRQREFFDLPGAHLTKRVFSALPSLEQILLENAHQHPGKALLLAYAKDRLEGITLPGQGHALGYGQWAMTLNIGRDSLRESSYQAGKNAAGEKESITSMFLSTEHFLVNGHQFVYTAPGQSGDWKESCPTQKRDRIMRWEFVLPSLTAFYQIGLFPKKLEYDHWASKFPEFVCCPECQNSFGAIVFERPEDAEEFQVYKEGKKKDPSLPFRVLFG